jgi:ATP-binding cassette subfamily C (CFTR/MRP) protein 1
MEFVASLVIVVLSRLEHIKAVRPSHLLQFFLLVLLLCNAVRLRTLFLMEYSTSLVTSASIHTFLTGSVGLFGKTLFWYLNGFFREGYRKILKPEDLINVDVDLVSKHRDTIFQSVWAKQDKCNKRPLLRTIVRVLWADLLLPVIPRYNVPN